MIQSSEGKAFLVVQEVIALVTEFNDRTKTGVLWQFSVEFVAFDDMVFLAKNMLNLQQEFTQNQIPGFIGMSELLSIREFMDVFFLMLCTISTHRFVLIKGRVSISCKPFQRAFL